MADKDPATAAAEAAAKELVKTAYGDLLQPAAREIGAELGEFVRAVFVAGRGFGHLIRETYEPFVLRALAKVPEDRRVAPPPALLGKLLEGVSYEHPGSHVEQMSSALLATAMDEEKSGDAHPAFVDVIHRISAEELEILKEIERRPFEVTARPSGSSFVNLRSFVFMGASGGFVPNADLVFDNLHSAGLISFVQRPNPHQTFRDLEHLARVVAKIQHGAHTDGQYVVTLSPFGRAFLKECAPS